MIYRTTLQLTVILSVTLAVDSCIGQENNALNEWSQWRGIERNGTWNLNLQLESLESTDLNKIWEVPVGQGYCGPTVANDRVYLMDYVGGTIKSERVLCIDAGTGNTIWIHEYKCQYSMVGYPTGPRA